MRREAAFSLSIAAFLLFAALGRHPYGFYIALRLAVTLVAVFWVIRTYSIELRGWTWFFAAIALLLNPFVPVRMHRADWQPIDFGLGLFFLGWSAFWFFRRV